MQRQFFNTKKEKLIGLNAKKLGNRSKINNAIMRSREYINIIKPADSELECKEDPALMPKKKEIHWISAKIMGN